jgi:hypothetical protein
MDDEWWGSYRRGLNIFSPHELTADDSGARIAHTAADAHHRHLHCFSRAKCHSGVTRHHANLRRQRQLQRVHLTALGLEAAERVFCRPIN